MTDVMLLLSAIYVTVHLKLDSFNTCSDSPGQGAVVTG
jgi:hypothetical protein